MQSDNQDKIYWHEAFFAALQLEFYDYADVLIFEDEHQLSKEALIMDVLVIKKAADVYISKNIGQIFKTHNIFEYKSETDNLSIWDYNKVVGYASLYSAFEEVSVADITVTFVSTPKPVKLLNHLANERGFTVDEVSPGIYHIKGDTFTTQILENKKLGDNIFLKNLRSSLTKRDMAEVFNAYSKYYSLEKESAYLSRIFGANAIIFREVLGMMDANVRQIAYDYFKEIGWIDREIEENKRAAATEMLQRNFDIQDIAAILKMPIEWVKNISTNQV
ncbi:MAG: hypothetical protein FWG64_12350 [Firmicutes bacterium]|nr:hypothetical protein [Bacillota bacterium]